MNLRSDNPLSSNLFLMAMILLLSASSCANRTKVNEKSESEHTEKYDIKVMDVLESMNNCSGKIKRISASKDDIIPLQDQSGKALLSQISAFEVGDNYIGLYDQDKLYNFSLPSGRLKGMLSAKGQGPEEYYAITDATIANDETFDILVSKWQKSDSEIKIYDMDSKFVKSIELSDFYGNLYPYDSESYVLTGAINSTGGIMPIVKYNSSLNENVDTIFIGEYYEPKTTFFQTRKIYRRHPSRYYFESGDTIYSITRDDPQSPQPVLFLDYKGLKYKNLDNKPIHENNDKGILLTDISIFDDNVYARLEKDKEIHYLVYGMNDDCPVYGIKVNPDDKKYGILFNIDGTEFCSWPISYWNGNLLFPVPDYVMSELFNGEPNPGLLKLSVESLNRNYND